jgi:signal transduction histidine kinase
LANEQRLAELQRNFVSMASHEFRTPMTVIDGHARRLAKVKESVRPAEIGERAGKIRSAVLRMTHLIENLLNSSRLIDAGAGVYFRPAEMDLVSLLDEVCQLHREMVPSALITERFAAKTIPMVGDSKLLFQVFSNIVSNAIKYSPGGGEIEVSAETFANEVVVAIADRGIGIPLSDLERLFERYHRGSNVSGIVGTGVGLHLVKMIVDLHGGRVVVNSREGEGSCFTIHLPIKDAFSIKVWSPVELESVTAAGAAPPISEPPDNSQPNSSQKVLSEMSGRPEG